MIAGRLGLGAAVLAVLVYLIFPVFVVVAISFSSGNFLVFPPPGFSLRWYQSIAGDPEWVSALWVTLKVGSLSALIAVLLGVPAAFALVRHVIPAKALLSALILCALVTPPIVTALSTYLFFVPLGLVNTVAGLAFAHAVSGMPFVVINAAASLRSADINLERAAVIHGAHPRGRCCASRCRLSRRASSSVRFSRSFIPRMNCWSQPSCSAGSANRWR